MDLDDRPISVSPKEKYGVNTIKRLTKKNDAPQRSTSKSYYFDQLVLFMFPDIPTHFPLKKKIQLSKSNSIAGRLWDHCQIMLTVLACSLVFIGSYTTTLRAAKFIFWLEIVITQLFVIDFTMQYYLRPTIFSFLADPATWLDIVTIVPIYVMIVWKTYSPIVAMILYFCRLIRIFRLYKVIGKLTGKNRHIAIFCLTLICVCYTFAGKFIVARFLSYFYYFSK